MVASGLVIPNLKKSFGEASWGGMINAANVANVDGPGRKVRVLVLDPSLNAAGLGALLAAAGVATASGAGEEQLVGALKNLSGSTSTVRDQDALLSSLGVKGSKAPLGIASEQGVWAFNKVKKPEVPAVPLYPAEGTINLDYPVVITAKDTAVRKAAEAFQQELGSESSKRPCRIRASAPRTARAERRSPAPRASRPRHRRRSSRPTARPSRGCRRPGPGSSSAPGSSPCWTSRGPWPCRCPAPA